MPYTYKITITKDGQDTVIDLVDSLIAFNYLKMLTSEEEINRHDNLILELKNPENATENDLFPIYEKLGDDTKEMSLKFEYKNKDKFITICSGPLNMVNFNIKSPAVEDMDLTITLNISYKIM